MNTKEVLLSEINLVCLSKPKLVLDKPKQTPRSRKVDSLKSGDDVSEPKRLECTDVLNSIVPPKEWKENGKHYRQSISNQPASKLEVKKLSEKLDTYLEKFNVTEVVISPIKREIYSQCFNEAIRLTTLNCVERGNMMIKIRDKINTTIDAYQKLYESETALKIRKAVLREEQMTGPAQKLIRLMAENEILEEKLAKILAKTEEEELKKLETCQTLIDRHAKEIFDIKKANGLIKDKVLQIIQPGRKN